VAKPPTRAEAAENLKAAAERLIELATMPVEQSTQHLVLHRAWVAIDDYEDASYQERKKESRAL
jgi:hypothetical protein